jgi:hypothetical protein
LVPALYQTHHHVLTRKAVFALGMSNGDIMVRMDHLTKDRLLGPPFVAPLPHVVVLGAGASRAAFPHGDRHGKILPLVDGLAEVVGKPWHDLLEFFQPPVESFEAQFSWLRRQANAADVLSEVERRIIQYFQSLELPDSPTIYDYLILGLRPKDTIATFNWDPLLLATHLRNRGVAELPDIRFLHGCVSYFTCQDHDVLGSVNECCPECYRSLVAPALFFPESEKDYAAERAVQREWNAVGQRLRRAFHLTIFGYSGPATDYNARKLLLEAWTATPMREVSHVEIIDVTTDDVLRRKWQEFIPFQHDMVHREFWESTIAKWPRRTGEYKMCASLYGIPAETIGPIRTDSLHELQDWHAALAQQEN